MQFINVAFSVSATVFFDGTDAEFRFCLASARRPFLIAAPPYGGGGFLCLVANADGVKQFELSFVIGLVGAIKIGVLNAQGRTVVGFRLLKRANRSSEIEALVEAVGEGSIACFSLCVFIQVRIIRQDNPALGQSTLYGFVTYRFTFKIGFAKYSFGITAQYTMKGNERAKKEQAVTRQAAQFIGRSDPPDCRLCDDPQAEPEEEPSKWQAVYTTRAPVKERQWRSYRKHIAWELL
jgi:hypothetical protein